MAADASATGIVWPIATIDVEASSLEHDSYPIEVGLAVWPARDAPVHGWSRLIRPDWKWRQNGHWSRRSQAIHGITESALEDGRSPIEVARVLNEVARDGLLWCDGGPYDAYWLRRLFEAAGTEPAFALGDWNGLMRGLGVEERECATRWLEGTTPRHRARPDAERLCLALAHGLGVEPGFAELELWEANLAGTQLCKPDEGAGRR